MSAFSPMHSLRHDNYREVRLAPVNFRVARQPDILYKVYFGWAMANPRNLILGFRDLLGFALRKEPKPLKPKDWLGGLDSNQDSQIQNLESCQLDDLPTY